MAVNFIGMTVDQILEALGGRKAIAQALGVSRTAPNNWRGDGIPARHWPDLVTRAAEMGVKGVTFEALRATGRMRPARHAPVIPQQAARRGRKSDTDRERGAA